MEKAVVLTSGGINSTVAAAVAREDCEPALIHVAWGHRAAERELNAFHQLAADLKIESTTVFEMASLAMFGGNPRVSRRMSLSMADTVDARRHATYITGLLPAMLSVAAAWATTIGARRLIVGIAPDHGTKGPPARDFYPDCRDEFLQAFNLMLHYAGPGEQKLVVEAPLLNLSRAEVIRLGQRLRVPFERTWSCYASGPTPCGQCWPCVTRATGFLQAGIPDPLLLEPAAV